jgi:hypothetical protein
MEHWVERPRAQGIAVTGEFIDHPLPVKFTFSRMVEDMQTDQSTKQILMLYLCRRHFKIALSVPWSTLFIKTIRGDRALGQL